MKHSTSGFKSYWLERAFVMFVPAQQLLKHPFHLVKSPSSPARRLDWLSQNREMRSSIWPRLQPLNTPHAQDINSEENNRNERMHGGKPLLPGSPAPSVQEWSPCEHWWGDGASSRGLTWGLVPAPLWLAWGSLCTSWHYAMYSKLLRVNAVVPSTILRAIVATVCLV